MLSTLLESSSRIAAHAAPALHTAIAGTAGFAGIVGVALAANALNDNHNDYMSIEAEIERLQQIQAQTPHPYLASLIALKIKNSKAEREEVLAQAGRNTGLSVSGGIGIAAGALAVAGLTILPVTIAAAAAAGVGLVGYGGYQVYKKRTSDPIARPANVKPG